MSEAEGLNTNAGPTVHFVCLHVWQKQALCAAADLACPDMGAHTHGAGPPLCHSGVSSTFFTMLMADVVPLHTCFLDVMPWPADLFIYRSAQGCSQYTYGSTTADQINMQQGRKFCFNACQNFCFITQASIDGCKTAASHLWCCCEPACEDLGILFGYGCCWSSWPSCDRPGYCCQGSQRDDCPYLEGTDILVHVDP